MISSLKGKYFHALIICVRSRRTVRISGKAVEKTRIILSQLRAIQGACERAKVLLYKCRRIVDGSKRTLQEVRQPLLSDVEGKTRKVIALEQVLGIIYPTSQVLN